MTQMELSARIAAITDETEAELRALAMQTGHAVAEMHHIDKDIEMDLPDGFKATLTPLTGGMTIGGQPVGNMVDLLRILDGLHKLLGTPVAPIEEKPQETPPAPPAALETPRTIDLPILAPKEDPSQPNREYHP